MTRIGFAKLYVADLDRMELFCQAAFGARTLARLTIDGLDEALLALSADEPELVLMRRHDPVALEPGSLYGAVGLVVELCDETVARSVEAGGEVLMPPGDLPQAGVRVAFVRSPEGHEFEIIQNLAAGSAPQ